MSGDARAKKSCPLELLEKLGWDLSIPACVANSPSETSIRVILKLFEPSRQSIHPRLFGWVRQQRIRPPALRVVRVDPMAHSHLLPKFRPVLGREIPDDPTQRPSDSGMNQG